jgi:gliotoxin/aspirochlorine biosynthesis O-methyltransferase
MTEDYPWEVIKDCTFLDVGGGAGGLVASILRKFPSMTGGVLDRPNLIEQAEANFHAANGMYSDVASSAPETQVIAGDFLTEVPAFEVYIMKWCLHDWNDAGARLILQNIRDAIQKGPRSRLIIFESILANGRSQRLDQYADLNMWIAVNGQERTESQWRKLAEQTGWSIERSTHCAMLGPVRLSFFLSGKNVTRWLLIPTGVHQPRWFRQTEIMRRGRTVFMWKPFNHLRAPRCQAS